MSHYHSELILMAVKGGWAVVQDFTYTSEMLNKDITVPAGYFTDLASVPRLMRWLVPVANAKNRKASVIHDYLCTHGVELEIVHNQKQADLVFREALGASGLGKIKSGAMYYPVRTFQWITGWFK